MGYDNVSLEKLGRLSGNKKSQVGGQVMRLEREAFLHTLAENGLTRAGYIRKLLALDPLYLEWLVKVVKRAEEEERESISG